MFMFDLQSIVQIGIELTVRQFPCPIPNQRRAATSASLPELKIQNGLAGAITNCVQAHRIPLLHEAVLRK
jgi:hypothetical protein